MPQYLRHTPQNAFRGRTDYRGNNSFNASHTKDKGPIDSKSLAAQLLSQAKHLLPQWLPNHRIERNEFVALNPTRPDKTLGSFQINLQTGRWADFATSDKGWDLISLFAYLKGLSQREAAKELNKIRGDCRG